MAYVGALCGAKMETQKKWTFAVNSLVEKQAIAWCAGVGFCFCMGTARADSGWEVWGGIFANQSFDIEAHATMPGMAGMVGAKAEHSVFKTKGYAGARVDLGKWVGSTWDGWLIEGRSWSVGSGLSPSMAGASANWAGLDMSRMDLSGLATLAGPASSVLAGIPSGQSSASEPIMAGWSLESQSVMAIRKFELGGGWQIEGGLGVSNKKINAISYAKIGADSSERQALSLSMQNASETLSRNFAGSAQVAHMAMRIRESAALAKSGALTPAQGAALANELRQFIDANPQASWGVDREAIWSEWGKVARQWVRDEALGAGSERSASGEGVLPELSLGLQWSGSSCGCSARMGISGIVAPRGYMGQIEWVGRKRLHASSWGEAGIELRMARTQVRWRDDKETAMGEADWSFRTRSTDVGLGIYAKF